MTGPVAIGDHGPRQLYARPGFDKAGDATYPLSPSVPQPAASGGDRQAQAQQPAPDTPRDA